MVFKICGQQSVNVSYNLWSEVRCMQSVICSLQSAVCSLQMSDTAYKQWIFSCLFVDGNKQLYTASPSFVIGLKWTNSDSFVLSSCCGWQKKVGWPRLSSLHCKRNRSSQLQCVYWNRGHRGSENQSEGKSETIDSNIFKSSQSNAQYKTMKSQLVRWPVMFTRLRYQAKTSSTFMHVLTALVIIICCTQFILGHWLI